MEKTVDAIAQEYKKSIEDIVIGMMTDKPLGYLDLAIEFRKRKLSKRIEKASGSHYEACLGVSLNHMLKEKKIIEISPGYFIKNNNV